MLQVTFQITFTNKVILKYYKLFKDVADVLKLPIIKKINQQKQTKSINWYKSSFKSDTLKLMAICNCIWITTIHKVNF